MRRLIGLFLLVFGVTILAEATWTSPIQRVRVSLLRATPGHLEALINELKAEDSDQLILRHAQGDQWDIMLIGRLDDKFGLQGDPALLFNHSAFLDTPVDFDETFTAACDVSGASLEAFIPSLQTETPADPTATEAEDRTRDNKDMNLFHIEMFRAAGGKHRALFQQRWNENSYLKKIGQRDNIVCTVTSGSDFDVFTIGRYRDMAHFATDSTMSDADRERAAKEAGFKNRADISFELRANIVGHQDTLATRVRK